MQGNAPSGLHWKDEGGGEGHTRSPVRSPPSHEHFLGGFQTEIDSPPPYLGDSDDDGHRGYAFTPWEAPDTEVPDLMSADARPDLGLFWTL